MFPLRGSLAMLLTSLVWLAVRLGKTINTHDLLRLVNLQDDLEQRVHNLDTGCFGEHAVGFVKIIVADGTVDRKKAGMMFLKLHHWMTQLPCLPTSPRRSQGR